MKIAVLTIFADNYSELANVTLPSDREYCLKHNYDFIEHKLEGGDYHYKKHELLTDLLDKYNVILYKDIDSIFTNHSLYIEDWVTDKDVYFTKDINEICGGVFIMRCTQWTKEWNKFILSQRGNYPNEQNVYNSFHKLFEHRIQILPQSTINSYKYQFYGDRFGKISGEPPIEMPNHKNGQWQRGDFILHCPGIPYNTRINILEEVKNHITK